MGGGGEVGVGGGRDWMGAARGGEDKAKRGTITKENTKKKQNPRTQTKKIQKKKKT